jgi:hypothetical protein
VLVISPESILYWCPSPNHQCAIATPPLKIVGSAPIHDRQGGPNLPESYRILLSDKDGGLHMLVLLVSANKISRLHLQSLGRTISPSAIVYLGEGLVLISGRQQSYAVYQLLSERLAANSSFLRLVSVEKPMDSGEVLATTGFEGPILDMSTVSERSSVSLVTCVGAGLEGGLQISRKGASIGLIAEVDLQMPVLRVFSTSAHVFAVGPVSTRVLSITEM